MTDRAVFTDNVDLKLKDKLDGKRTEVANVKDPSRTVTARITVQPGAAFGWHTHPGPVVVNVVEGELTVLGCSPNRAAAMWTGTPARTSRSSSA